MSLAAKILVACSFALVIEHILAFTVGFDLYYSGFENVGDVFEILINVTFLCWLLALLAAFIESRRRDGK